LNNREKRLITSLGESVEQFVRLSVRLEELGHTGGRFIKIYISKLRQSVYKFKYEWIL